MRKSIAARIEALRAETEATLANDQQAIAQVTALGQRIDTQLIEVIVDRKMLMEWQKSVRRKRG